MWVSDIIYGDGQVHLNHLPSLDSSFSPLGLRRKAVHEWNKNGIFMVQINHITRH